ncbi:MAG: MFS transporter [Anaerolineae bacterium]|nr:MFS transporter [Thermoflexales bacterium]MDW8406344.1 MFS transporter [Anaerolineae bacterium]
MAAQITDQHTIQAAPPVAPILDSRRNFWVFTGDIITFSIGIYFIPTVTVLVGLASKLTDDKALIGAVGMMWSVSWFLPQLFAARLVRGKRREKPYLIIPSLIGRQMFILFAAWLFFTEAQQPILTIWLLILAILIFNICDALAGVAWFDMLSRALSPRMRGRSMAIGQFIGAIGGVGVGLVVERILAPDGLPFPLNYAVIFTCAWLAFTVSLVIILFLQENPVTEEAVRHSQRSSFFTDLRAIVATDALFRRVLLARFLTAVEVMAAPFYVVFGREQLNLPDSSIGAYSLAFIIGSIAGIVLFGWQHDRFGTRRVLQASSSMQFIAPALCLVLAIVPVVSAELRGVAYGMTLLAVGLNGAVSHSLVLGYLGYVMDNSAERYRATYVGVFNTISGLASLTPVLGGALMNNLSGTLEGALPYAVVFAIVVGVVGAGLLIAFRLPPGASHHASLDALPAPTNAEKAAI